MDSKEEIQQYGSKENGNAVVQYSVSGSNTVKVGETITLTCNNKLHWPSHNWYTFGNSVAVEGDTKSNTITVKGLKEGTATVYCSGDSKQINVTDPQYVIRFYVSGTGTEGLYDEQHKYSVAGQPNSTFENAVGDNPLKLFVSAGYAILTGCNDTAKNISTNEFKDVRVTGDEAVRAWLTEYANNGVPKELTNRENVESIVAQVNEQYETANTKFYQRDLLPSLQEKHFNGFRFVDAYYVGIGESTIHVNVQLVKNDEYTVHYDPNDGTENVKYDSTLYQTGDSVKVKDNMFARTGYEFAGWNTEADGTGMNYNPGNEFNIENANVTLYAKWTPKKYEVKYHLNYEGSPADPATKTNVQWNDSNLLASEPDRANYTFNGWYTAATGGTKVTASTKYSEIATNEAQTGVDLYAQWTQKKYEVKYHLNYEGSPADPATKTNVQWNDSNLLASEPDRANYTFNGWYTAATGGTKVTASTKYSEIATNEAQTSVDLYAQWKATETSPTTAKYTVEHYKWDTQKKEYTLADTDVIDSTVGAEVTATAKKYNDGYILNEQKSKQTKSGAVRKDNTLTLELYYDVDKIGKGENLDQPDGIIDRYQVTIIYKSSDEGKGTVSTKKEVLTIKRDGEKIPVEDATIKGSKATDNGGRNYFSNWTDEVNKQTINDATLTAETIKKAIETAEGGEIYTFTANFGYSSGGGSGGSNRPKPPVVEIPDDVPTGLNGKDHYAYIIGYGNNDVRPQNNITRAEVATIFFRLLTDETREANMTKSNGYNDVKDGDWFCCAVSTLSKMGIIKGYEDGSFKPNDPISRAEFAAIAARFDPNGDKTPASFSDVTSHWAKDEISIAANHGWIKGYEDGSFKPDQKITRAETMTLVNRVLNRLPETKDDLHKDMKTWVDNMDETAWYYLAVQEATNSHYFKNKTGTKFEQWTDLRDTRDWSELEK